MTAVRLPEPERSRAVLIAVSEHTDPQLPGYPGLATGARELGRLLTDPEIWGLPEPNVQLVTGADATREGIKHALTEAATASEEAMFVYYGGHGLLQTRGGSERLRLPPHDASLRFAFDCPDFEWLREFLRPGFCKARHRILALDTCHSGAALDLGALDGPAAEPWAEADRLDLSTLLTACEKFDQARVPDEGRAYSSFTAALIDTLDNGVDGAGATLTGTDVHRAIQARVGTGQTPRILSADGAGTVPMFGNRRGATELRTTGRVTIPLPPTGLVGRAREVGTLVDGARRSAAGAGPFVAVVTGRGGMGKSAIVQQAASELAQDFPHWRLYVDLHTWTPGQEPRDVAQLLEELLQQVGQARIPTKLAERAARWSGWLSTHKALIVLEDAKDVDQLRLVLPPSAANCALFISSRDQLPGLTAVPAIEAGPLSIIDSGVLMNRELEQPVGHGEVTALAEAVGRVPKALASLAVQLRHMPPDLLLGQLHEAGSDVLARLFRNAMAQLGDEELRETARACWVHPGPDFDAHSIAAITKTAPHTVSGRLHRLASDRLIKPLPDYRFRLHDEDVGFGAEIAQEWGAERVREARARWVSYLCRTAVAAGGELWGRNGEPDPESRSFAGPKAARTWLYETETELIAAGAVALADSLPGAVGLTALTARWLLLTARFDLAENIIDRLESYGGEAERVEWHFGRGEVSRVRQQFNEAQNQYHQALTASDGPGRSRILRGLGEVARGCERWDDAKRLYRQALELSEAAGDQLGQADAQVGLGAIAGQTSRWEEVRANSLRLLEVSEASGNRLRQTDALLGLGVMAGSLGDDDEAEKYYQRSFQLAEAIGNRVHQAQALAGLGIVAQVRERWDEAERYFQHSLRLAEAFDNRLKQCHIICRLGGVALSQENWVKAEQHYRQAWELAEAVGDRRSQATAILGSGNVARNEERWADAGSHYRRALELAQAVSDRHNEANANWGLGWVNLATVNRELAMVSFVRARDLYSATGDTTFAQYSQQLIDTLRAD